MTKIKGIKGEAQRIWIWLLLAALVLTALPQVVATTPLAAAETGVPVTVRIEAVGETLLPKTALTVESFVDGGYGLTDDGGATAAHALVQAATGAGLALGYGGYLTSVAAYANDSDRFWLFMVNNETPLDAGTGFAHGIGDYEIQPGDNIVFYFAEWMTAYRVNFDTEAVTVEAGEPLALTLTGINAADDLFGLPAPRGPIAGALLLADDGVHGEQPLEIAGVAARTDAAGRVELSFAAPGVYTISALRENADAQAGTDISRPYCLITVTEPTLSVALRLEGLDGTIVPRTELDLTWFNLRDYFILSEANSPSFVTPLHALVRLLENLGYDPRDSAVLEVDDTNFGAYLQSVLGRSDPAAAYWMELINDASGMGVGADELRDGDEIVLALADFNAEGAFFTAAAAEAVAGEPFTLTLQASGYDENWNPVTSPVAGAAILISEKNAAAATQATEWVTGPDGQVTLTLAETGRYVFSAVRHSADGAYIDITRPYCLVTVRDEPLTDEVAVATVGAALRLGDLSAVTSDLALPVAGAYGTTLTWHSDRPAVLGVDGRVTRPAFAEGEANVSLTATISKGAASTQRIFTVIVPALPDPLLATAQALLDNARKYYEVTRGKTLNDFWDLAAVRGAWGNLSGYTLPDYSAPFSGVQPSDYAGRILGMLAVGLDPAAAGGQNIVAELGARQTDGVFSPQITQQAWAVIALHAAQADALYPRDAALSALIAAQETDGSFDGPGGVLDTTAMALTALAGAAEIPEAAAAGQRAIAYFRAQQNAQAGWSTNANTTAIVISALTAAGENLTGGDWDKNGQNPVAALGAFQMANGGFAYATGGQVSNHLATYQSIIALRDLLTGACFWYDMTAPQGSSAADKAELAAAITACALITGESYTEASFQNLVDALAQAQAVYDNPSAAAADIIAAVYALEQARAALVPRGGGGGGGGSGGLSVRLTVEGDSGMGKLLNSVSYTVDAGTSAFDLIIAALDAGGFTYELGFAGSYIQSVNGLAEAERGPNSGWLYRVNNALPDIGSVDYILVAGDHVRLYYTLDYTQEAPTLAGGGSLPAAGATGTAEQFFPGVKPVTALDDLRRDLTRITETYLAQPELSTWELLVLGRAGLALPERSLAELRAQALQSGGNFRLPTDLTRLALLLQIAGQEPADFAGLDLIRIIREYPDLGKQGVNGYIFALLVLTNSGPAVLSAEGFTVAAVSASPWDVPKLLAEILTYQNSDGGFSLAADGVSDPDITAMALQALAPWRGEEAVQAASTRALLWLQTRLGEDGLYATSLTSGGKSSESLAQVIIALTALNLNPDSAAFVREERTLLQGLLRFQLADGTFADTLGGESSPMATEQAFLALTAYERLFTGLSPLYSVSAAPARPDLRAELIRLSLALAREYYSGADSVILTAAEDEHLIDTALAAALAGERRVPVLHTYSGDLDAAVGQALTEMGVKKALTVGAVTDNVAAQLRALGLDTETLRGQNRLETAALVAGRLRAPRGSFIAGWNDLENSASLLPYAAAQGFALLLTEPSGALPPGQKPLGDTIYLVGTEPRLAEQPDALRLAGEDIGRFNRLVLETLSFDFDRVYLADGSAGRWPLALALGPAAALTGSPVVLAEDAAALDRAALAEIYPEKVTPGSELVFWPDEEEN
ncbi:MAG: DUF4430 domain-containing protein [Gracilibacteraceae bacterium]|jgi:hypothetical protein|nr:DUF4430 domain-containing protein [Gracilibacteraceae bacterium]